MSSLIEDSWTLIYFNLWYGFWLKYMKKNPIWCSWKGADFSDNWDYSSDPTSKLNHTLKSTAGATVKNFTMLSKSSTQNNIYESIYIISTNRKKKSNTCGYHVSHFSGGKKRRDFYNILLFIPNGVTLACSLYKNLSHDFHTFLTCFISIEKFFFFFKNQWILVLIYTL